MNQIPCVPMTNPYMVQQQTTYMPVPQQPKYNAVNIEISNPSVGAQGVGGQQQAAYAQPTMPLYNYPQAPVYNYPQTAQQPCYMPPQMSYPTPASVPVVAALPQEAPKAPDVQQQNFNQPVVITGEKSFAAFTKAYPGELNLPVYHYDGSASDENGHELAQEIGHADAVVGIGAGR